jgi:hypothetical protein
LSHDFKLLGLVVQKERGSRDFVLAPLQARQRGVRCLQSQRG